MFVSTKISYRFFRGGGLGPTVLHLSPTTRRIDCGLVCGLDRCADMQGSFGRYLFRTCRELWDWRRRKYVWKSIEFLCETWRRLYLNLCVQITHIRMYESDARPEFTKYRNDCIFVQSILTKATYFLQTKQFSIAFYLCK